VPLKEFKEGVGREEWEKYYRKDDIAALENLCHKIQVKVWEAYFVGGGVPHLSARAVL